MYDELVSTVHVAVRRPIFQQIYYYYTITMYRKRIRVFSRSFPRIYGRVYIATKVAVFKRGISISTRSCVLPIRVLYENER